MLNKLHESEGRSLESFTGYKIALFRKKYNRLQSKDIDCLFLSNLTQKKEEEINPKTKQKICSPSSPDY